MTMTPPRLLSCILLLASLPAASDTPPLIVVEDGGGASALPYYRALNLQTSKPDSSAGESSAVPRAPRAQYREADLLPVRSVRLSPGRVDPRVIHVPGLTPLFLIGDDPESRQWLQKRIGVLHSLNAAGLVVHVESEPALKSLRQAARGLTLTPTSGDDLAQRLNLQHYPVLITATGIEQ